VGEPMHDVSKHIENVLTELPSHIANAERKKLIEETIALTIGGKDTKQAFDYRCTIINVSNQIKGVVDAKVQALVDTLVEIQEVLYKVMTRDVQETFSAYTTAHGIMPS